VVYCATGDPILEDEYRLLALQTDADDDPYTVAQMQLLATIASRGECPYLHLGRVTEVIERWVARLDSGYSRDRHWLIRIQLARLHAAAGDKVAAVRHLGVAGRLRPDLPGPALLKIRYQLELGDYAGARHSLELVRRVPAAGSTAHSRAIRAYEDALERIDALSSYAPS
jgi:hypothetical protein